MDSQTGKSQVNSKNTNNNQTYHTLEEVQGERKKKKEVVLNGEGKHIYKAKNTFTAQVINRKIITFIMVFTLLFLSHVVLSLVCHFHQRPPTPSTVKKHPDVLSQ